MNNQIVTVNLVPGLSAPAVVRVSQYDVGRPLTIRVFDGTGAASFGASVTATIVGTKPSGLGFTETGTIAGNTVTLNTTLAMTQECGMIPAEIRFTTSTPATVIGTANFILAVEPSPHPEGTTDGTQETMQNLETRLQGQIDALDSRIDAIEGDQSIIDDIDALDARVTALEQGGSGLSQTEKNLILTLFSKAAYAESDAESAYDALENLWTTTTRTITYNLSHVSSSNTTASVESGQSYTTTLTASTDYTLNAVTVTMGGVDITATAYSSGTVSIPSVTGNIVITATAVLAAQSITATYTQSGTVYDTDSLDSLKADLVVTANFAGGTSETVPSSDYTLSGTLAEGTSVVTVSYAGLTTTFNVTVSEYVVSLDTVIYEDKSYRDIFMTANQLQGFDFESGLPSGTTSNSGSPELTTEDSYSTSHSVKAFGSSSAQYRSVGTTGVADWTKHADTSYFTAYKAKCTRYTKGSLGVSIVNGIMPSAITAVTDGWVTTHAYTTTTSGNSGNTAYIGSYSQADLDGYVDDIVIIPMTDIFTNIPTEAQMLQWYNEYCDIRKAGGV